MKKKPKKQKLFFSYFNESYDPKTLRLTEEKKKLENKNFACSSFKFLEKFFARSTHVDNR